MPPEGVGSVLRVALIGSGQHGELYARALGHLEQVELVAVCGVPSLSGRAGRGYANALSLLEEAQAEAVVFASPSGDPQTLFRRALLRRKHVLATGPFRLSALQTERLAALAQRAGCLLMFGEERFLSPGFAFVERAVASADGSWRGRYLRLLDVRVRARRGALRLGSLAVEDLAACLRLVRRTPRTVSAIGSKGAGGSVEAAFINMVFPGGTTASLQVSLNEAAEARQIVAALGSRTIVLDDLDPHLPLRVMAESITPAARAAGALAPAEGGLWQLGSLAFTGEPFDGPLAQLRRFLDALASQERLDRKSNAEVWGRAASLWEAAEGSMALAGAPVPIDHWSMDGALGVRHRATHLRVIPGGRAGTVAAAPNGKRPGLKVLSG